MSEGLRVLIVEDSPADADLILLENVKDLLTDDKTPEN